MALLWLPACGGQARSSPSDPGVEVAATGGTGAGGVASAGSTGSGGTATPAAAPFYLDDAFPWFPGSGRGQFPVGQSDEILHVAPEQAPSQATFSTHNVSDLLSGMTAVHFLARANPPFRLMVSATDTIHPYDYFAARAAGEQWPLATVDVGEDWQTFEVPLTDMQPPETTDDGIPSFFLAFIVDDPRKVELWLDQVYFR